MSRRSQQVRRAVLATTDLVEVCRSFSYKLNIGNYQSQDFFCSQKKAVPASEVEAASEALYQFCRRTVLKEVAEVQRELKLNVPADSNGRGYLTTEERHARRQSNLAQP